MNKSLREIEGKRILILCIDRDNDVGLVTGAKTPIIGYEDNLNVAVKFAKLKPEDSDVNTMFAAIQLYERVRAMPGVENCEIATVTGLPGEGVDADFKVAKELTEVLSKVEVDGAILVSDGATDEYVLPLISSMIPIISVRRVIVQQVRGVEELYVAIARYFRQLLEDKGMRRLVIGVPSALLILYSIFYLTDLLNVFWAATALLIGLAGIVKAFEFDKLVAESWEHAQVLFVSLILAAILLGAGIYIGYLGTLTIGKENVPPSVIIGTFLSYSYYSEYISSTDLIIAAAIIILISRGVTKFLRDNPGVLHGAWHEIVGIMFLATFRLVIDVIANILKSPSTSIDVWIPALITNIVFTFTVTVALTGIFAMYERILSREKSSG